MGRCLHLGRNGKFERVHAGAGNGFEAAEPLAQPAGACEDVDYTDCAAFAFACCGQDLDSDDMVDVMSADKRSALMSRIRGKDTGPELRVRKQLWRAGFRYRLHAKGLPGKPDLVLPKWEAVVFVHGCFWHCHAGCPYFRLPKTRPDFWDEKLRRNQERDETAISALIDVGWRVAVVWECAVRSDPDAVGRKLAAWAGRGKGNIQIEGLDQKVRSRQLPLPRI